MTTPHDDSLCARCIFFAEGACPRFRATAEVLGQDSEEIIVSDCGGFAPQETPTEAQKDLSEPTD